MNGPREVVHRLGSWLLWGAAALAAVWGATAMIGWALATIGPVITVGILCLVIGAAVATAITLPPKPPSGNA
jgi:hypothetical protein